MIEQEYKEVAFYKYCETCKHFTSEDSVETCNECLDNPIRQYSEKPVKYEEK